MLTYSKRAAARRVVLVGGLLMVSAAPDAAAQTSRTSTTLVLGELASIVVRDAGDAASGGHIVVSGKQITVPDGLMVGLASDQVPLRDLLRNAPPECQSQEPPQSGLAASDSCRGERPPALVRVVAGQEASGALVARVLMIEKDSGRTLARIRPQRDARARANGAPAAGATTYSGDRGSQAKQ